MSKKEEVAQYSNIVFLDDVVGSGETLWRVMRDFCNRFHLDGEMANNCFMRVLRQESTGQQGCKKAARKHTFGP